MWTRAKRIAKSLASDLFSFFLNEINATKSVIDEIKVEVRPWIDEVADLEFFWQGVGESFGKKHDVVMKKATVSVEQHLLLNGRTHHRRVAMTNWNQKLLRTHLVQAFNGIPELSCLIVMIREVW